MKKSCLTLYVLELLTLVVAALSIINMLRESPVTGLKTAGETQTRLTLEVAPELILDITGLELDGSGDYTARCVARDASGNETASQIAVSVLLPEGAIRDHPFLELLDEVLEKVELVSDVFAAGQEGGGCVALGKLVLEWLGLPGIDLGWLIPQRLRGVRL